MGSPSFVPSQIVDINGDFFMHQAGGSVLPYAPVAYTATTNAGTYTTGAAETGNTWRWKHVATADCSDIRIAYANATIDADGSGVSNKLTITASIEVPANTWSGVASITFFQLQFDTGKTKDIQPGQIVLSLPLGIELPAGTTFFSRVFVSVPTATNPYPIGMTTSSGDGEGVDRTSADLTMSGTISAASAVGYSPLAILGRTRTPHCSVAAFGDSISIGAGDTNTTSTKGYLGRALYNTRGMLALGKNGSKVQTSNSPTNRYLRMAMAGCCRVVIDEYGINDLYNNRTAAQVLSDKQNLWAAAKYRGCKVFATTITPCTTSTDTWATTGNQQAMGMQIIAATNASPIQITCNAIFFHGMVTGNQVTIAGVAGNTAANGTWTITKVDNSNFTLNGSTGNGAFSGTNGYFSRAAIDLNRTTLNDNIRNNWASYGIDGYFEIADTGETARNSGIWLVGSVSTNSLGAGNTGIHPNATGHAAAAAVLTSALSTQFVY